MREGGAGDQINRVFAVVRLTSHQRTEKTMADTELRRLLLSALDKLGDGMDRGPDGGAVELTPAEATLLYRVMTENLGIEHRRKAIA